MDEKQTQWYSEERSEHINEITDALAKVQGALEGASKGGAADFATKKGGRVKFKYADLKSVWEALRKPLSDNCLAIFQTLNNGCLSTTLAHSSGQWYRSTMPLPHFSTMQELGGIITYMRRYQLTAMTGVYSEDTVDQNDQPYNIPTAQGDRQTGKPAQLQKRPTDLGDKQKLSDAIKKLLPEFRVVESDKADAIETFLGGNPSLEAYKKTLNKMKKTLADLPPIDGTADALNVGEPGMFDKDGKPIEDPFE